MIKPFLFNNGVSCNLSFLLDDEPNCLFLRVVHLFVCLCRRRDYFNPNNSTPFTQ